MAESKEEPPEPKQRKLDKRYLSIRHNCYTYLLLIAGMSSNRFATEPAGFGDALLLDAFMRYDNNAYNKSSNPEVSGHCMDNVVIR